jgi:hypothetical protein
MLRGGEDHSLGPEHGLQDGGHVVVLHAPLPGGVVEALAAGQAGADGEVGEVEQARLAAFGRGSVKAHATESGAVGAPAGAAGKGQEAAYGVAPEVGCRYGPDWSTRRGRRGANSRSVCLSCSSEPGAMA